MVTFVELPDDVIECFEILIVFLDVLFMLLIEDEILGCLSHCFDELFDLLIIEVGGFRYFV